MEVLNCISNFWKSGHANLTYLCVDTDDNHGDVSACLQVYIRILDNEWNVYRRYTEFRELHNHLRSQFPQVDTFNFPPKKAIGNKVSW